MVSLTTKMVQPKTVATNSYTASVAGLIKRDARLALKNIAHSVGIIGVSSYDFDSAVKTSKGRNATKIRNRYNQVPHVTQDTTWESDKTQLNITNKSQEVSPFPTGYHKAAMNRRESMTITRHK